MSERRVGFNFERLEVYVEAKRLAVEILRTARSFPVADQRSLGGQMQRAAISVASNLAEGSARLSAKDQAHFTNLAYSSLMEVVCQIEMARDLELLSERQLSDFRARAFDLARGLSALHGAQRKRREARA